jgi:hypothetical protein
MKKKCGTMVTSLAENAQASIRNDCSHRSLGQTYSKKIIELKNTSVRCALTSY